MTKRAQLNLQTLLVMNIFSATPWRLIKTHSRLATSTLGNPHARKQVPCVKKGGNNIKHTPIANAPVRIRRRVNARPTLRHRPAPRWFVGCVVSRVALVFHCFLGFVSSLLLLFFEISPPPCFFFFYSLWLVLCTRV